MIVHFDIEYTSARQTNLNFSSLTTVVKLDNIIHIIYTSFSRLKSWLVWSFLLAGWSRRIGTPLEASSNKLN